MYHLYDEHVHSGVVRNLDFAVIVEALVLHSGRDLLQDAEAAFVQVKFVFVVADILDRDGLSVLVIVAPKVLVSLWCPQRGTASLARLRDLDLKPFHKVVMLARKVK